MKNKKIGMVNVEDFQQGIKKALAGANKKARSGWEYGLLFTLEKNKLHVIGCSGCQIAAATMDIDGGEVETCHIFLTWGWIRELQEFLSLQISKKVRLEQKGLVFVVDSFYDYIELNMNPDIQYPDWKHILKRKKEALHLQALKKDKLKFIFA